MVRITITERDPTGAATLISSRTVELRSKKQLTGERARKILAREEPELGTVITLVEKGAGFVTSIAVKPGDKCSYHYTWREYYIAEE